MRNTTQTSAVTATAIRATTGVQTASAVVLMGITIGDSSHGQVHLHLHNGGANTTPIVALIKPANGDHETHWFGPNGIACPNGIFVDLISGTPIGSVFTLPTIK
jgi:hypothetical protein